jgi:Glyoxalase-like domain
MAWVHAVIDAPESSHEQTARFWEQALGWPVGRGWERHPELRSFEPAAGEPYLHLQRIEGAQRVHIDVEVEDPDAAADRAVRLGAELVGGHDQWQVMRSPGGLLFCLLGARERTPPAPVTWADGHRSRPVQVCIDSPASAHDREVAFWKAMLPDRWFDTDGAEFAGKWHDDAGSPLQLLFQRLDEPTGLVRAHLDHGTDDVPAEVRRLLALGAIEVGPGHGGWHVLRDPSGMVFCVTENSPEQAIHRDLG